LEVEILVNFWTVASSGKPSVNFSVPSRVSTLSGATMAGGISVLHFWAKTGEATNAPSIAAANARFVSLVFIAWYFDCCGAGGGMSREQSHARARDGNA
jgi:hypothetical protein